MKYYKNNKKILGFQVNFVCNFFLRLSGAFLLPGSGFACRNMQIQDSDPYYSQWGSTSLKYYLYLAPLRQKKKKKKMAQNLCWF